MVMLSYYKGTDKLWDESGGKVPGSTKVKSKEPSVNLMMLGTGEKVFVHWMGCVFGRLPRLLSEPWGDIGYYCNGEYNHSRFIGMICLPWTGPAKPRERILSPSRLGSNWLQEQRNMQRSIGVLSNLSDIGQCALNSIALEIMEPHMKETFMNSGDKSLYQKGRLSASRHDHSCCCRPTHDIIYHHSRTRSHTNLPKIFLQETFERPNG